MYKLKVPLILTLILIFGMISSLFGQGNTAHLRTMVLKKGIKDSIFVFSTSEGKERDETQLKYLGTLKSNDGKVFKVLTYCWLWGHSVRATNRILIYDVHNRYLGCYAPDMKNELPVKIERNELVFSVKEEEGLEPIQTRISFPKGLPRQIEINGGNLYSFLNLAWY